MNFFARLFQKKKEVHDITISVPLYNITKNGVYLRDDVAEWLKSNLPKGDINWFWTESYRNAYKGKKEHKADFHFEKIDEEALILFKLTWG